MRRETRGWVVVLGLGLGSCAGKSQQSSPDGSAAGAASLGATGLGGSVSAPGGSGPSAGGVPAGGDAMTGGQAGAAGGATACMPGTPASCSDDAIVTCTAEGVPTRTECGANETCVDSDGPHCELADLPLGLEPNEFGFTWRDAFMLLPCYEVAGHDCLTVPTGQACPNQDAPNWEDRGLNLRETFEIGGEVGKVYKAHLVVNGVVAGKYYRGGARDAGADFSSANAVTGADAFHRDGYPIPSSYDAWQITVRDATGELTGRYYLNSFPQASGFESHQTVLLGYEKDIEVPGGGTIEYRVHDSNCRAINNCNEFTEMCGAGRRIPNEPGLTLPETWQGQPLAAYDVVSQGNQPFHTQITHLRVTKVTYLKEFESPPVVDVQTCEFADSDVSQAVQNALHLAEGKIPKELAGSVVGLDLDGHDIDSLEGIECLVSLQELHLDGSINGALDFSPLAQLPSLRELSLRGNDLTDLAGLENVTRLVTLYVNDNALSDLTLLSNMTWLTVLDLTDNAVTSLTPLVDLPSLGALHANGNPLDCATQGPTLDTLCAKLLGKGEWHVDCGPQPSSAETECPNY